MKPLDRTLLTHTQIEDLKTEKAQLEHNLSSANPFRSKISKPALMSARIRSIDHSLSTSAPEPLAGDEKDKLAKLEVELRDQWTQGMPTEEEMRKNPAGMVDRHRKWEAANKRTIMRWKNVRRQLEPDSEDPDLANIERYRPSGTLDRLVSNAQIPGAMNYRSVPQANWDAAFGKDSGPDSALKQAKRGRGKWTEEQKREASEKYWAKRKQREHDEAPSPAPIEQSA